MNFSYDTTPRKFQRVNFRQYLVCLRERIFNWCNVLMLSWSWSSRSNSGGYLRDYRPQWTPFFSPFPVVTLTSKQYRGCGVHYIGLQGMPYLLMHIYILSLTENSMQTWSEHLHWRYLLQYSKLLSGRQFGSSVWVVSVIHWVITCWNSYATIINTSLYDKCRINFLSAVLYTLTVFSQFFATYLLANHNHVVSSLEVQILHRRPSVCSGVVIHALHDSLS